MTLRYKNYTTILKAPYSYFVLQTTKVFLRMPRLFYKANFSPLTQSLVCVLLKEKTKGNIKSACYLDWIAWLTLRRFSKGASLKQRTMLWAGDVGQLSPAATDLKFFCQRRKLGFWDFILFVWHKKVEEEPANYAFTICTLAHHYRICMPKVYLLAIGNNCDWKDAFPRPLYFVTDFVI